MPSLALPLLTLALSEEKKEKVMFKRAEPYKAKVTLNANRNPIPLRERKAQPSEQYAEIWNTYNLRNEILNNIIFDTFPMRWQSVRLII